MDFTKEEGVGGWMLLASKLMACRDAAKQSTMHRTALTTKNHPARSVDSAKFENLELPFVCCH